MPTLNRELTDPYALPLATWPEPGLLARQTHWIRNTLDPLVAHSGGEALSVNDVLSLDAFLRKLHLAAHISLTDLRTSRIHLAIVEICGRATRWPAKLTERAEVVLREWEERFGSLRDVGWEVERLERWEGCEGLKREEVLAKWVREGVVQVSPGRARKWGDLGFKAGDWWINTLFAYRAGIIDSADPRGGIVWDSKGAYAVLLTDGDEIAGETPERFNYRSRPGDKGRYRLTAATIDSRQPVRILRAQTLRSFWAPRAGVRYEGMYKVASWSISDEARTDRMHYDITFKRLPTEPPMDAILARPWAEEIEDYREYKRLRQAAKAKVVEDQPPTTEHRKGSLVSTDGAGEMEDWSKRFRGDSVTKPKLCVEVYEDETAESPGGSIIIGGRWPEGGSRTGVLTESSVQH